MLRSASLMQEIFFSRNAVTLDTEDTEDRPSAVH